jgi:transcriptional antiterminator NusG
MADEPQVDNLETEAPEVIPGKPSLLAANATDELKEALHLQKQEGRKGWYVIHTYSGYEDQVAENLVQRAESFAMQDKIFNVVVPKEKQIEIKNGKRKTVEKRIFPGYVMVEMIVTDDSWYVVRNTPNVTGFIGLGVQPTPISPDEVARIQKRMGVEEPKYKIELQIDDLVKINDGPLKGFEGKVTDVDNDKGKIKVSVSMFGRETPVSLDFLQVKKV